MILKYIFKYNRCCCKVLLIFFIVLFKSSASTLVSNSKLDDEIKLNEPTEISIKIINESELEEKNQKIEHKYLSLFEDLRPRYIGDTITVILQENITASNSSSANISRNGNNSFGVVTSLPKFLDTILWNNNGNKTGLDSSSRNDFNGRGNSSAKNTFIGIITVKIKKLLTNGYLQVEGEKKITINQGTELIRFSGIVNPNTINKNNSVISTQVADARIEYFSNDYTKSAQSMGWLQRFFMKFSPI